MLFLVDLGVLAGAEEQVVFRLQVLQGGELLVDRREVVVFEYDEEGQAELFAQRESRPAGDEAVEGEQQRQAREALFEPLGVTSFASSTLW